MQISAPPPSSMSSRRTNESKVRQPGVRLVITTDMVTRYLGRLHTCDAVECKVP